MEMNIFVTILLLISEFSTGLRFLPETFKDITGVCLRDGKFPLFLDFSKPSVNLRLDDTLELGKKGLFPNTTLDCDIEIQTVLRREGDKEMSDIEALSLIILELNFTQSKTEVLQVITNSYFGTKTTSVTQEASYGTNRIWANNPTFLLSGQLSAGFDTIDNRHRARHFLHEQHIYPPDRIFSKFDTAASIQVRLRQWSLHSRLYLVFTSYRLLKNGVPCSETEFECPTTQSFREATGRLCMAFSLACNGIPNCGDNQIPNPDESCYKIHWSNILMSLVSYILLAITLLLCMSCFARILIQWSVRSSLYDIRSDSLRSSSRFFSFFGGSFSRWERPPPTYDEALKHFNPDTGHRPPDPPPYSDRFRPRMPLSRSLQALRGNSTSPSMATPPPEYASTEDVRNRSNIISDDNSDSVQTPFLIHPESQEKEVVLPEYTATESPRFRGGEAISTTAYRIEGVNNTSSSANSGATGNSNIVRITTSGEGGSIEGGSSGSRRVTTPVGGGEGGTTGRRNRGAGAKMVSAGGGGAKVEPQDSRESRNSKDVAAYRPVNFPSDLKIVETGSVKRSSRRNLSSENIQGLDVVTPRQSQKSQMNSRIVRTSQSGILPDVEAGDKSDKGLQGISGLIPDTVDIKPVKGHVNHHRTSKSGLLEDFQDYHNLLDPAFSASSTTPLVQVAVHPNLTPDQPNTNSLLHTDMDPLGAEHKSINNSSLILHPRVETVQNSPLFESRVAGAQRKLSYPNSMLEPVDMDFPLYDMSMSSCDLKPQLLTSKKSPKKSGGALSAHNYSRKGGSSSMTGAKTPQKISQLQQQQHHPLLPNNKITAQQSDNNCVSASVVEPSRKIKGPPSSSVPKSGKNLSAVSSCLVQPVHSQSGNSTHVGDSENNIQTKTKSKLVKPDDINIKSFIESS